MKTLTVIGQGYVGLPLSLEAVKAGFRVFGLDISKATVDGLNNGISNIDDISDREVSWMVQAGYIATTDSSVISDSNIVVICVPTPLQENNSPDLNAVKSAVSQISQYLKPGTLVVLESTTYPGTTQELILPILESTGFKLDIDFYLAFSPERIDPGNASFTLKNTPKVVGGVSSHSTRVAEEFYALIVDEVVPVKGAAEAEMSKLLENTYRHVNIALVNELAQFSHELGIDIWEVIDAARSKPFGFQAFYPGPGVGGHCIPIDPNYLGYRVSSALGRPFRFVELATEINSSMPKFVVARVQDILNDVSRSINGTKILLLGMSYKPNISDVRESPSLDIFTILRDKGAQVSYHDPHVQVWMDSTGNPIECVTNLELSILSSDLVILLQDHDEYDLPRLVEKSNIFFDTKGKAKHSSAISL